MRQLWLVFAAAALVGACEQKAAEPPPPPAKPPVTLTVAETPTRKTGLWSQHTTVNGSGPVQFPQLCVDAGSERTVKPFLTNLSPEKCAEYQVWKRSDGGWAFHSVCDMGVSGVFTTDGEATGDFETAYRVSAKVAQSVDGRPDQSPPREIVVDAQYLGACPPDMKPGDVVMSDGRSTPLDGAPAGGR